MSKLIDTASGWTRKRASGMEFFAYPDELEPTIVNTKKFAELDCYFCFTEVDDKSQAWIQYKLAVEDFVQYLEKKLFSVVYIASERITPWDLILERKSKERIFYDEDGKKTGAERFFSDSLFSLWGMICISPMFYHDLISKIAPGSISETYQIDNLYDNRIVAHEEYYALYNEISKKMKKLCPFRTCVIDANGVPDPN